jgi:hypothetical protein
MAGDRGEIRKPVADHSPQLEKQETAQHQVAPGNRARVYRRDAVWILGVVGGILLSAIRPELDHPHDYWAAAIGASSLFAAICLYLYDALEFDGRAWTLSILFGAMMMISVAIADRWTYEFRAAQIIVAEKSPPEPTRTAIAPPQLVQPRFHEVANPLLTIGRNGITVHAKTGVPAMIMNGFSPFTLRQSGDALAVDVKVWGGPNAPYPIEIANNNFVVRPLDWDRNSNDSALEIVDEDAKPMFQLVYLTPEHILIKGIFPMPDGEFLVADDDGVRVPVPSALLSEYKITPIFKYPSWKYPGEYARP